MNMQTKGNSRLATLCAAVVVLALVAGCIEEPRPVMVPVVKQQVSEALTVESARRFLRSKPHSRKVMREVARYRAAKNREAVFLMVKYAAQQGLPEAQYEMGRRYDPKTHSRDSDGIVLRPDEKIAAEWFEKAASRGHKKSVARLGELYKDRRILAEWEIIAAGELDISVEIIRNEGKQCKNAWKGDYNSLLSTQCQAACLSKKYAYLSQKLSEIAATKEAGAREAAYKEKVAKGYNRRADIYCSILSRWGAIRNCPDYCL